MSYNLPQRRGECLSSTVRQKSHNWFAFSTDENSETLESSAINDGRSMLAMFLTEYPRSSDFFHLDKKQ